MKKSINALLTSFSFLLLLTIIALSCSKKDGSGGNGPSISSISPASALTGATITITGQNLSGSSVEIGGISSEVTDNTATSITTSIPSGAGTGEQQVVVRNSQGTATSRITVTGAGAGPVITSITPAQAAIGETITITGTGLANAVVEVYKKVAAVKTNTATSITVTIPAAIPTGQAAVDVTTPLGHITSSVIIK